MGLPDYITVHPTRFPELGYARVDNVTWRIIALEEPSGPVGPQYRTRAELLGDLTRYAANYGCEVA